MITSTQTESPLFRSLESSQKKPPSDSNPFFRKIQDLIVILAKYKGTTEESSRHLFDWGAKFAKFAYKQKWNPRMKDVVKRIEKLKSLLKDPIHGAIFHNPWFANGILWEKQVLDLYQDLHQQKYGIELKSVPHTFMQEILEWMGEVVTPLQLQQEAHFSLEHFEHLIDLHVVEKQQRLDNKRLKLSKTVLSQGSKKKQRRKKFEKELQKVKIFAKSRIESLKKGITEIKQESNQTRKTMKESDFIIKQSHKKQKKILNRAQDTLEETKTTLDHQANQINSLSTQAARMQGQLSQLQQRKDEGFLTKLIKKIF